MVKQNLHCHTTFDDGANTPEEMVQAAIKYGLSSLGITLHAPIEGEFWTPPKEKEPEFIEEMHRLKEKYKGTIDIYCGLELEMHSDDSLEGYDYIIGSTHYFKMDGEYVGFDRSAQEVKRVVDTYFHGDGMEYAKAVGTLLLSPASASYDKFKDYRMRGCFFKEIVLKCK